jgi:hypothetical protein
MTIPTIKHLLSIGLETIAGARVQWDPYGRKPWRLATGDDWIRCEPGRYRHTPNGLPYEFNSAKEALEFGRLCCEKLQRHLNRAA